MSIFSKNGRVFHGGTTEWVEQLASDPIIQRITRNVLNHLRARRTWDWELIGQAINGRALTALNNVLFIATSSNRLQLRYPVGADVPWRESGHAQHVVALAGDGDTLFSTTTDNQLRWRAPVEHQAPWTAIGSGPAAGTKALAAAGGMLYAVDADGQLWRRAASRTTTAWVTIDSFTARKATINAMAAYSNILFASTTDGRLLRTNQDWIDESSDWIDIHHCNFSAGIAVVDGMLFLATTENRLWWLDLHGLRMP
jgi:hypothetical protein